MDINRGYNNFTVEEAIKHNMFGFDVECNGDAKKVELLSECSYCRAKTDKGYRIYCNECIRHFKKEQHENNLKRVKNNSVHI